MKLTPKNWASFQHYKHRRPPWIKFHKTLLDDYDFLCLPIASRALAPMLWLLASEHDDGIIEGDATRIAFRLRMSESEFQKALQPLLDKGFFSSDSTMLASCQQSATTETETEKETETETENNLLSFDLFWDAYDKKRGRPNTLKEWTKINPSPELARIIVRRAKEYAQANPEAKYRKDPERWIKGRHWEDEIVQSGKPGMLWNGIDKQDFTKGVSEDGSF